MTVEALQRGVLYDCEVSVQSSPDLTVQVAAGAIVFDNAAVAVDAVSSVAIGAADTSTAAAMTTALTGANNDLLYTAQTAGDDGNGITVEYRDPAAASQSLSVDVQGTTILVMLATDGGSAITSTAALIDAAIAANTDADALVAVTNAPANSGAGVVTAMDPTSLSGGLTVTGRIDSVMVDSAGTVSVLAGTAANVPVPTPSTDVVLARVYVALAQTTVVSSDITDARALVTIPSDPAVLGWGIDGDIVVDSNGFTLLDPETPIAPYSHLISSGVVQRDLNPSSLTVAAGVTLDLGGYMIFCPGVVSNQGTITCNGGDASGITGGTAAPAGATATTENGPNGTSADPGSNPGYWGYGGKPASGGGSFQTQQGLQRTGPGPTALTHFLATRPVRSGGHGGAGGGKASTQAILWPSGGSSAQDGANGALTNPGNVAANDGSYAQAIVSSGAGTTKGEKYGNWGFNALISSAAVITSVVVEYEFKVSTTSGITTARMRALVSGAGQGNHDDATEPTSDKVVTVDITGDRSWTRANLLDGTFEVSLQAINSSATSCTVSFDYVKVTVGYTTKGGGAGAGAGVAAIAARVIDNSAGVIEAKGGDGGDAEPGAYGGAPGAGGVIALHGVYVPGGTLDVSAGAPGSGDAGDGVQSGDGNVFLVSPLA